MISPRKVTDSSCNSCGERDRVIEFKIGRGTTEHVVDGGGLLVRFCRGCRHSLLLYLTGEALDELELGARCNAWMYPGHASWNGKLNIADGQRCILAAGHQGDHRLATMTELIDRSSIGEGLRNIRENGIDAELARFRVNHRGTRKPPATRMQALKTRMTRKKASRAPKAGGKHVKGR